MSRYLLLSRGLDSEISYDPDDTKYTLLQYVRLNRPVPSYAAQLIAADHGHLLYYTPPYHPDLQPIELIWGRAKNQLAMDPSHRIDELKRKLQAAFNSVTSENWVAAYKHVQRFENSYRELQNTRSSDDENSAEGEEVAVV